MKKYRKSNHCVYDINYHIVWSTKYRKALLRGEIAERVCNLLCEICRGNKVTIIKGTISVDHVHLLVSVPPHISASMLIKLLKGNTSRIVLNEFENLKQQLWNHHFWAKGYFVASHSDVTSEVIKKYIETHDRDSSGGTISFEDDQPASA